MCEFCERHLEANKAAFADPRLQLIINDARAELEAYPGTFDVIIGDLADPVFGGPCYQVCQLQRASELMWLEDGCQHSRALADQSACSSM